MYEKRIIPSFMLQRNEIERKCRFSFSLLFSYEETTLALYKHGFFTILSELIKISICEKKKVKI